MLGVQTDGAEGGGEGARAAVGHGRNVDPLAAYWIAGCAAWTSGGPGIVEDW